MVYEIRVPRIPSENEVIGDKMVQKHPRTRNSTSSRVKSETFEREFSTKFVHL